MTILDFTEQNHVVLDFSGNVPRDTVVDRIKVKSVIVRGNVLSEKPNMQTLIDRIITVQLCSRRQLLIF